MAPLEKYLGDMDVLFCQADKDMGTLKYQTKCFLNVNELVWGWRKPNGPTDLCDLIGACAEIPNIGNWLTSDYWSYDDYLALLRMSPEDQQLFLEKDHVCNL